MKKMNSKAEWVVKNKIKGEFTLEKFFEAVLENRGIEDVEDFLNPEISKVPNFKELYDCKSAAHKIVEAVKKKKKVVVYGDYDVDGICGCCLVWSFLYFELPEILGLKKEDLNILPYIPDRVDEGYGLSKESLDNLVEKGVELIVTVDCGVRDKELINEYSEKFGIEFVITDHHLPPDDLLDNLNYILVHQLYPKKEYPYHNVCGAFVAYLLVLAMKDYVGVESSVQENTQYLDLVALPTVTDIMPLHGVNRIVVKHGLETIRQGERLGLKKLAQASKIELDDISTYHLGFLLGPRLNAAGRIGSAMDGLKLLATNNESTAEQLALKLDGLNYERQQLTAKILQEAREKVGEEKLIFVSGQDWNEGIIGLVASKLQEEFYRPVIVVSITEEGIKGSARSINGLNITEAIEKFGKFLVKFGGHSQAAGFSVKEGELENFENEITKHLEEEIDKELLKRVIDIDLSLDAKNLNMELAESLSRLEPFGYGNKKPVFLLEGMVVVSKRILGKEQNHMKLEVKGDGGRVEEAIMFNCPDDIEKIQVDDVIDLVGNIGINEWNGLTKVQLEVKDWRACNEG